MQTDDERWRYVQFATVNQFYMLASRSGVDFHRILEGCRHNYPRMAGMPGPGFAAGPCLVKDTMQLAAFSQNHFMLGHAARLVNEGLPSHVIELARRQVDLSEARVGILGMAFKAESDDPRDSLSYKLRKLLTLKARQVLCTDPYVTDPTLVSLERVLTESNVLFVRDTASNLPRAPASRGKTVIDVWNCVPSAGQSAHGFESDRLGQEGVRYVKVLGASSSNARRSRARRASASAWSSWSRPISRRAGDRGAAHVEGPHQRNEPVPPRGLASPLSALVRLGAAEALARAQASARPSRQPTWKSSMA